MLSLSVRIEKFPLKKAFTISRGSKTEAVVVTAEITDGTHTGRGECLPYARYKETPESVSAELASFSSQIGQVTQESLQSFMQPGSARNALDCALWDYEAKRTGISVWERAGIEPKTVRTAYTISLDTPEAMALTAAEAVRIHTLLKIKLGRGIEDVVRLRAVRRAAPNADIIVDVNEGWTEEEFKVLLPVCREVGVLLLEQPLAVEKDDLLRTIEHLVPICADESTGFSQDLLLLKDRYDGINIKLDKMGGLTEALKVKSAAKKLGMKVVVGCHVSTSLSMAPAMLLAADADFVDLDGPLLLAKDREPGLQYTRDMVAPPVSEMWG